VSIDRSPQPQSTTAAHNRSPQPQSTTAVHNRSPQPQPTSWTQPQSLPHNGQTAPAINHTAHFLSVRYSIMSSIPTPGAAVASMCILPPPCPREGITQTDVNGAKEALRQELPEFPIDKLGLDELPPRGLTTKTTGRSNKPGSKKPGSKKPGSKKPRSKNQQRGGRPTDEAVNRAAWVLTAIFLGGAVWELYPHLEDALIHAHVLPVLCEMNTVDWTWTYFKSSATFGYIQDCKTREDTYANAIAVLQTAVGAAAGAAVNAVHGRVKRLIESRLPEDDACYTPVGSAPPSPLVADCLAGSPLVSPHVSPDVSPDVSSDGEPRPSSPVSDAAFSSASEPSSLGSVDSIPSPRPIFHGGFPKRSGTKRSGTKRTRTKRSRTQRSGTKCSRTQRSRTKRTETKRTRTKRSRFIKGGERIMGPISQTTFSGAHQPHPGQWQQGREPSWQQRHGPCRWSWCGDHHSK
jgi:hypothetical protein